MAKPSEIRSNLVIRSLEKSDFESLVALSDEVFGPGYMEDIGLEEDWSKILLPKTPICWVVESDGSMVAARISYPPGQWSHTSAWEKSLKNLWKHPPEKVAYFKTSMVKDGFRGQGLGKAMAKKTIDNLKVLGAKAAITHSWNESPGGSSSQFTSSVGFHTIGEIQGFWSEYIYACNVCNQKPCACTASEMIMEL